jgi:hypothetical protein
VKNTFTIDGHNVASGVSHPQLSLRTLSEIVRKS